MLPSSSVLIDNVSKEDEGSYECTAFNSQGTMGSSRKMQIIVKGFLIQYALVLNHYSPYFRRNA
ncbi:hypothetical protein B4U80_15070 [Leptotrombidium deliense]|uniref:Ig-like domain-containing protein n=1 Tax=Leptotrombidium deliense TaxID=299467 RepID=A0A443QRA9_9ACAR|nr:hypothetical protein B4U80_15070 [Leptotrombidium deliense]